MVRLGLLLLLLSPLAAAWAQSADSDPVATVTIRAERDIGYFAGDLIKAEIAIAAPLGAELDPASLPGSGPVAYWLDLRDIRVDRHTQGDGTLITLSLLYQTFYVALDARPMEIPAFTVQLRSGGGAIALDIPPWNIGVSPLREVAPPVKEDPKDYLQPDHPAPYARTGMLWRAAGALALAAGLSALLLAFHRGWGPFRARTGRVFAAAARRLRTLGDGEEAYVEALRILHRGIDQTDGRSVMAEDMTSFLDRRPAFAPLEANLSAFFAASRRAFFASAPDQARRDMPFDALKHLARAMARAERSGS